MNRKLSLVLGLSGITATFLATFLGVYLGSKNAEERTASENSSNNVALLNIMSRDCKANVELAETSVRDTAVEAFAPVPTLMLQSMALNSVLMEQFNASDLEILIPESAKTSLHSQRLIRKIQVYDSIRVPVEVPGFPTMPPEVRAALVAEKENKLNEIREVLKDYIESLKSVCKVVERASKPG